MPGEEMPGFDVPAVPEQPKEGQVSSAEAVSLVAGVETSEPVLTPEEERILILGVDGDRFGGDVTPMIGVGGKRIWKVGVIQEDRSRKYEYIRIGHKGEIVFLEGLEKDEVEAVDRRDQRIKKELSLAQELSESREAISFPGIYPASYERQKEEEEFMPEGFVTPIDDLLPRFKNHGMKIVISETPGNLEVYVIPCDSNDPKMDGLFPRHLDESKISDPRLKKLIELGRS